LPGSGTTMLEASLRLMKQNGKRLLFLTNGAYGDRLIRIAEAIDLEHSIVQQDELSPFDWQEIKTAITRDDRLTTIAMVHCETSTGQLNDLSSLGEVANARGLDIFLDSMSSFGGVSCDYANLPLAVLVSSSNKCLHGIPGFGFALINQILLNGEVSKPQSFALDLKAHWKNQAEQSEFLFTPSTHALIGLREAISELEDEGGVDARSRGYAQKCALLTSLMRGLGFKPLLRSELRSNIITAFEELDDLPFSILYEALYEQGFVIYPGKVSQSPSFRIGNIGALSTADIQELVHAVAGITRGCP
jgi:2-aminoethylphosphonate-pyruvate transaminase